MSKIPFQINTDTIADAAQIFVDRGEYESAISVLRRDKGNVDALLDIAQILSDMELFNQSNDALYQVLALEPDNEDAKQLLGQNNFARNNFTNMMYYLPEDALEYALDSIESGVSDETGNSSSFLIVYPKDKYYVKDEIDKAGEDFARGDFKKAYEKFASLNSISPHNVDILNRLIFACIMLDKYDEANTYLPEAIQLDELDPSTLANAVLLYEMTDKDDLKRKYLDLLDKVQTDDSIVVFKIAAVFCESKEDAYARKWLDKYLDKRENLEVRLLYAIACYNCKDFVQAKQTLFDILAIEPDNATVAYYMEYLVQHSTQETFAPLEYTPQIPSAEITKRIAYLQSANDFYGMWNDQSKLDVIVWGLTTVSGDAFSLEILRKIADTDNKQAIFDLFSKMLLTDRYSYKVKEYCLRVIMAQGYSGVLPIVSDGRFYDLLIPVSLPQMIVTSVRTLISTLAVRNVLTNDNIADLAISATQVQSKMIDAQMLQDNLDDNLVASVILRQSRLRYEDKDICKLFDVTYDQLVGFCDRLVVTEKD